MKAYLRSVIPHLESGIKSSKSKDMYVLEYTELSLSLTRATSVTALYPSEKLILHVVEFVSFK